MDKDIELTKSEQEIAKSVVIFGDKDTPIERDEFNSAFFSLRKHITK